MEILIPIINSALEKKRQQYPMEHWGGSTMGSCFRKRYMARAGIKQSNPISIETLKVFDLGNAIHHIFKRYFKDEGVMVEEEKKIENTEYDYVGHVDAILKIRNELIVVEGKSIHPKGFAHLGETGKPEHLLQLASYIYFLNKADKNITKGKLLYISKNPSRLRFMEIPKKRPFILTKEWRKKVENDLNTINKYWKRKQLPPKLKLEEDNGVKMLGWECRYCSYSDLCFPNKNIN